MTEKDRIWKEKEWELKKMEMECKRGTGKGRERDWKKRKRKWIGRREGGSELEVDRRTLKKRNNQML